jgi:uncharacterized membrane protein YhaH (DUF805 family)
VAALPVNRGSHDFSRLNQDLLQQVCDFRFNVATVLPSLAAGARRVHDTDRSGWWQLLVIVPLVGWIVLIVFWVQESRPNRYAGSPNLYA